MSIFNRMRKETACYWAVKEVGPTGNIVYEPVVELSPPNGVRWEESNEVFVGSTGEEVVSNAKVYLGQRVDENGVLWRGKLQDLPDWDHPLNNPDAYVIRQYNEMPNLRNTKRLRIAFL